MIRPHRYDAVVINYHEGIGPSATREMGRRPCATKIGADFCRRFLIKPGPAMSILAGNYTLVTTPGSGEGLDVPEWYEKLWAPLYWIRSRWDGLRYGLDRDRR